MEVDNSKKRIEEHIYEYLNKGLVKFPKELKKDFKSAFFHKSIWITRMSLVMGFLLYSVFAFLDVYLVPEHMVSFFIIRFGIVVPLILLTLAFSFSKYFKKAVTFLMSLIVFCAGFGIIIMIAILKEGNFSLYYYAGLILVIMWAYTFTRLRFNYATIACWSIVFGYELTAIFFQDLLSTPDLRLVFINNNFFFIASNILGMFVAYFIELTEKRDFLQGRLLEFKQEELLGERNQLATKNKMIQDELEMAKIIQDQLIPKSTPGKYIATLYKPMSEIGGDFYDFFRFKNSDKIGLFLSDVSGHGVPAALITSMIKSILVQTKDILPNPSAVLKHLNEILVDQTQHYFVTVFYGIYDKKDHTLLFANGGHTDPYVCDGNRISQIMLKEHLPPIGIFTNEELDEKNLLYHNYKIKLPIDSKLLIYTDGLIESKKNINDEGCFEDEIKETLSRIKDQKSEDFVQSLYSELKEYKGNDSFDDDICIICMDTDNAENELEELEELDGIATL